MLGEDLRVGGRSLERRLGVTLSIPRPSWLDFRPGAPRNPALPRRRPALSRARAAGGWLAPVAVSAALWLTAWPSAPVAADPPSVAIASGAQFETVYDWARDRCETWDVPDAPLRAFRNDQGEVIALASDKNDRPLVGPSLERIRHVCGEVYTTKDSANPADFSGWGYVVSTWTNDGHTVYGLVHNEFHAERFPGACRFREGMKCWYNVVVAVRSADGGRSFHADDPPVLVAAPPFREDVDQGRHRGFFSPSNIVARDGFYYTVIGTTGGGQQRPGGCLFRTATLSDPHSWRAFDGTGFTSRAIDPYREDTGAYRACQPVTGGLPAPMGTMVWSQTAHQFLAVMTVGPGPGRPNGGIMTAWSSDLLHWSGLSLLLDVPTMFSSYCGAGARYAYASIVDPASPSRNFDVTGNAPYLYLSRFNLNHCKGGPNRDLVRIRLAIGAAIGGAIGSATRGATRSVTGGQAP